MWEFLLHIRQNTEIIPLAHVYDLAGSFMFTYAQT